MFEIIALPNPSQLKESSVNDAMDTPKIEVNFSKYKRAPALCCPQILRGALAISALKNLPPKCGYVYAIIGM